MTTATIAPTSPSAVDDRVADVSNVEAARPGLPDFHVGVRGRIALAFAGLMLPAAAFLYFYGQLSPGV